MTNTANGYELLLQDPGPPPETLPLLKKAWDAHRAEDWLLNGRWPDKRGGPGDHLSAAGADASGRWATHDGKRLRASDCQWLRHITEVQTIRRTWWRTRWQTWPPAPSQPRDAGEIRIALDCDPESPVQMFQLYAALGADQKPVGPPELRTFHPDADTEMPTDATIVIATNQTVDDLLEWLAWLLFDGRRSVAR